MRRIVAILLAASLAAAACSEAFDPPTGTGGPPGTGAPGGGTSDPGVVPGSATPSPGPTETPAAAPQVVELAKLPTVGDGPLPVKVLGWIETGGSVRCGGGSCTIDLVDPRNPRKHVALDVPTGPAGARGTMRSLGSSYREADLQLTADNGTVLWSGSYAWVTGSWDPDDERLVADGVAPGRAPALRVVGSTIAQLRSRRPGTLVRVSGRLATPWFLSCWGGTCNLYLEDGRSGGGSVRIEVRLGPRTGARPNTMRPLTDNFRDSQLRVFDLRTRVCRADDRVVIVGWVYRNDDGSPYIDPVQTITRLGS